VSSSPAVRDSPRVDADADGARTCRRLSRAEFDRAIHWATGADSHLGLDDTAAFWGADPEGWWGIEVDGSVVGLCGTLVRAPAFGSLIGPYLLPHLRGRGIGAATTSFFLDHLRGLLGPDPSITTDVSPGQRGYFEDAGFHVRQISVLMSGTASAPQRVSNESELRPLAMIPFEEVEAYDSAHAGISRRDLLRRWVAPAGGLALAALDGKRIVGIGVICPARNGYRAGPLVADSPGIAEELLGALCSRAAGEGLVIAVPESNADALTLASSYRLRAGGVHLRMTHGPGPDTHWQQIYGLNSLSLR